jgi:hypothetical protein
MLLRSTAAFLQNSKVNGNTRVSNTVLNLFVVLLLLQTTIPTPMVSQLPHLSIMLYKWAMVQHGSEGISYRAGKSSFNPLQSTALADI